ncbi:MAG: hypothetical protein WBX25_29950, partial [Rhodomicrobium sp.]
MPGFSFRPRLSFKLAEAFRPEAMASAASAAQRSAAGLNPDYASKIWEEAFKQNNQSLQAQIDAHMAKPFAPNFNPSEAGSGQAFQDHSYAPSSEPSPDLSGYGGDSDNPGDTTAQIGEASQQRERQKRDSAVAEIMRLRTGKSEQTEPEPALPASPQEAGPADDAGMSSAAYGDPDFVSRLSSHDSAK